MPAAILESPPHSRDSLVPFLQAQVSGCSPIDNTLLLAHTDLRPPSLMHVPFHRLCHSHMRHVLFGASADFRHLYEPSPEGASFFSKPPSFTLEPHIGEVFIACVPCSYWWTICFFPHRVKASLSSPPPPVVFLFCREIFPNATVLSHELLTTPWQTPAIALSLSFFSPLIG